MEIKFMPMPKKLRTLCVSCGNENKRHFTKTCSNSCEQERRYEDFIEKWKSGVESGVVGFDQVSNYIRKYLMRKYNNACQDCEWSRVNPTTNKVPVQIEHIDGDWNNNIEANLKLLCPNCHSLTPTYGYLNKGKGRKSLRKNLGM